MLEVGALSVDGACARSGMFSGGTSNIVDDDDDSNHRGGKRDGGILRIDLNSRHPKIQEVDLMQLPPPPRTGKVGEEGVREGEREEGFDIVSLSLVVNYVGEAADRGEMLKRVESFFRYGSSGRIYTRPPVPNQHDLGGHEPKSSNKGEGEDEGFFPALFLVLPAPCVTNSRYLDESRLTSIMQSLGYRLVKRKLSAKLAYYLWRFVKRQERGKRETFSKKEICKGGMRNNFAIVLE